jgi:O-antigen/teichoic acid export membrane protein
VLNNIKSTIKNSFIYSLGNLSTKLVGLILIPLYTKYLSVSEYGVLAILEITTQLVIAVFGFKINAAFFRWYWDEDYKNKQKSIFFTSYTFSIFISLILIIGLLQFSKSFSLLFFNNENFSYLLKLMFITAGLQIISLLPSTLMRLQEKPILYSVSNMIRLLFTLIFTIYFIVYLNKKVEAIYEAQIIGIVIYFIILVKYILRNIEIKFELEILREMLVFSFPLIFVEISSVVFTITSRYCLKFLGTLSDVGTFSLGFKIANSINVFVIGSAMLAIWPIIYKKMNDPDSKRFYSKIMTYFSFVIMICVLSLSLFSREIMKFLTENKDYWAAYEVIPIISLTIFFSMLKSLALIGLNLTKKTKIIALIITSMTVLNIGLNLFLVFFWKSIGAATATLISQIVFFIFIYRSAQNLYYIPYEILKILKVIIIGVLLFLLSLFINDFGLLWRILIKSTLIILFPLILYFVQFYEDIELLRLKQGWKKWSNMKNWKNITLR